MANYMEEGVVNANEGVKYSDSLSEESHDAYNWAKGYYEARGSMGDQAREETYIRIRDWDRSSSILKITPMQQMQRISASYVTYINKGLPEPEIQRIPISNVKVIPHQVSFDFFDTTEGKIGASNAKEKHMAVEFDVYVSEIIYFYWNHWGSENGGIISGLTGGGGLGALTGLRFFDEQKRQVAKLMKDGCDVFKDGWFNKDGEGVANWLKTQINPWAYKVNNFEDTQAFINFRNIFLQQFTGWVCKFTSQTFGIFEGVFTDISYEIEDGYTDAKWHCKVEEAIFGDDYSEDGTKPSSTSGGSEDNSG